MAGAAPDSAWSGGVSSSQQRYDEFYRPRAPEYFLVTDFESLEEQPDLRPWLDATFKLLVEDDSFLVYDLRQNAAPAPPQ